MSSLLDFIDSNEDADFAISQLKELLKEKRQNSLLSFTFATMPTFQPANFHRQYYNVLTKFAQGEFKKLMVFMPPQHGKALQVDTPVLTTEGWKKHSELKPGDYVFGEDGKPKMVRWNSGSYWHRTQQVNFADKFFLLAAPEHEWVIYADHDNHRGRQREIVETQDIFKRHNRRNPAIQADIKIQMPEVELPINPYLLGVWLGDGNSKDKWVCCGEKKFAHLRAYIIEYKPSNTAKMVHLKGLETRALRLLGVLSNKHIPISYLLASYEQRMQLLQGLMDSDGYVDKRGRCEFCQKESKLADDVYVLLRSLGYKPTKHTYKAKLYNKDCGNKVRISFTPQSDDTVFGLLYKQQRIQNKITADRSDKKKFFITSIIESTEQFVNCIEVEGGVYLAGKELVPTHNSEGSTRRLPPYLLGRNPDTRIAIVSYSSSKARKFNREIQRIIDTEEYREIFPNTMLNSKNASTTSKAWLRNADECEIVGHKGGFKTVGVGGALTGESVDILIMDDIYKDAKTAWSATVRESINDWYDSVAETRLHNDSQQLIVFTRWHEEDLAGKLLNEQGEYDEITNPNGWKVVIYQAIKDGEPTEFDPRQNGEPLWAEKHSLESLIAIRNRNQVVYDSLYQQDPKPAEGLMYTTFKVYDTLPIEEGIIKNYTDTADTGDDYLCSITYLETLYGNYVLDIIYTQKPMEVTEIEVAKALTRLNVAVANIESNNGGRGFARNVEKYMREMNNTKTIVRWFHQGDNKITRIFTHSADVQNMLYYPRGWEQIFPEYAKSMKHYKKVGKNPHDDAQDAATGTIEKRDINRQKINLKKIYQKVY